MEDILKYFKNVGMAVGKLVFGIYLFIIAVFGGAFIAEFIAYHLIKGGIVHLPEENSASMENIFMLLGLILGSPIIIYVIKMYIPKTKNERNKV